VSRTVRVLLSLAHSKSVTIVLGEGINTIVESIEPVQQGVNLIQEGIQGIQIQGAENSERFALTYLDQLDNIHFAEQELRAVRNELQPIQRGVKMVQQNIEPMRQGVESVQKGIENMIRDADNSAY
jgi:hypothetical protein